MVKPPPANRLEAVVLPAVDPGQEMSAEGFQHVHRGKVAAAFPAKRCGAAVRRGTGERGVRIHRRCHGDRHIDNQPVGNRPRSDPFRQVEPDRAGVEAIGLDSIRPTKGYLGHRGHDDAQAIIEPEHGNVSYQHGLLERFVRAQNHRTVQLVVPRNPKEGAVIGPFHGHPSGLRTQIDVGGEGDEAIGGWKSGALIHQPARRRTPRP